MTAVTAKKNTPTHPPGAAASWRRPPDRLGVMVTQESAPQITPPPLTGSSRCGSHLRRLLQRRRQLAQVSLRRLQSVLQRIAPCLGLLQLRTTQTRRTSACAH